MRVAIIHYWLVGMRGGERVLEQLCHLFPQADIYTHVIRRDQVSDIILRHPIRTTSVARLPFASRLYTKYLPFMPRALEELDLSAYDLVISSESGPAKGVIVRPTARHICYCHSPMRYLWDHYNSYRRELSLPARLVFGHVAHGLRIWDVTTAARVDTFVANSSFVAERIHRYYRREADIVHPPIALERFGASRRAKGDYYLMAGELVGYKRAELALEAFRGLDRKLLVAGDGGQRGVLEKTYGAPNISFLGRVSDEALADLYAGCRALLFPGEEDFGMVPIEAMASGRPVIAYGSGGALDSVKENVTGLFFREQTVDALRAALRAFEENEMKFDSDVIRAHASDFSEARFRARFSSIVARVLAMRGASPRRISA